MTNNESEEIAQLKRGIKKTVNFIRNVIRNGKKKKMFCNFTNRTNVSIDPILNKKEN